MENGRPAERIHNIGGDHHHQHQQQQRMEEEEDEEKMDKFFALIRSYREARDRCREEVKQREELEEMMKNETKAAKKRKADLHPPPPPPPPRRRQQTNINSYSGWVPRFEWEDFSQAAPQQELLHFTRSPSTPNAAAGGGAAPAHRQNQRIIDGPLNFGSSHRYNSKDEDDDEREDNQSGLDLNLTL